jgi:hypothetical protein
MKGYKEYWDCDAHLVPAKPHVGVPKALHPHKVSQGVVLPHALEGGGVVNLLIAAHDDPESGTEGDTACSWHEKRRDTYFGTPGGTRTVEIRSGAFMAAPRRVQRSTTKAVDSGID